MGMCVHESGGHDAPASVYHPGPGRIDDGSHFRLRPYRDHGVTGDRHDSARYSSEVIIAGGVAGEHLRRTDHEEVDLLTMHSGHMLSPAVPFPAPVRS